MVKGVAALHARFKRVPGVVRDALVKQIEKEANKLVSQMNAIKPNAAIVVDWTWGDAPAGTLKLAKTSSGGDFGKISATIYATAKTGEYPKGFKALAVWFEFGTADRVQKKTGRRTGRITASPYFYPVYRANKSNVKRNLTNAVRRAIKKA